MSITFGKLTAERITALDNSVREMFGDSIGMEPPYYVIREGNDFLFEVKDIEDAAEQFAAICAGKARELFISEVRHKTTNSAVFSY